MDKQQLNDWLRQPKKDKNSLVDDAKKQFPVLYKKAFGIVSGKGKGVGKPDHINALYARIRVEALKEFDKLNVTITTTKINWLPSKVEPYIAKLGYVYKDISSNLSYANDNQRLEMSEYYQHPVTNKTVRVSDHAPVHARSSNHNVLLHPNSFENDGEALKALIDNAGMVDDEVRRKVLEMNEIMHGYKEVQSE